MSPQEANDIAREAIAFWQGQGIEPDAVWRSLGFNWSWQVEWWEVRAQITRWYLHDGFKQGPLPRVPVPLIAG